MQRLQQEQQAQQSADAKPEGTLVLTSKTKGPAKKGCCGQ